MPTPVERLAGAAEKAGILAEALPWLQRFHGQVVIDEIASRQKAG